MLVPYKAKVYVDQEPKSNFILMFLMVLGLLISWLFGLRSMTHFILAWENIPQSLVLVYFIHNDLFHLIGNVLFLWTFGNAINCRLGNLRFVVVFFTLGILSSMIHLIIDGSPAIGASGAISGIVGMFLFLFPRNDIECIFILPWFSPIIRKFSVPGMYLIVFWFVYDLIGYFISSAPIAYMAHIGGMLCGFLLALILVKMGWITFWQSDRPLIEL
ncbi:MAG: rhomboid family intramembrane serine protease [Leptospiraceae bacterium]|nr:rhomboid family intramembrane serine protease [Leptospiraceae bacterium]